MVQLASLPVARAHPDIDDWLATGNSGEQLAALAMSRPQTVLQWCDSETPRLVGVLGASFVWQARALAAREMGDATSALRYIRRAVRFADSEDVDRRGGLDRASDVRASLATTLAEMGRGRDALQVLDEAERLSGHAAGPRVQMRKGAVLRTLGRREEALAVLGAAIPALRSSGDLLWEARALSNRAIVHLDLGSPHRAG